MVGVIHGTVIVHTDTDLITARFIMVLTDLVIVMDTMTAIMQGITILSIIFMTTRICDMVIFPIETEMHLLQPEVDYQEVITWERLMLNQAEVQD